MIEKQVLKPMDIYSDYRTPLDVAIFCRGHKFSVEVVAVARALKAEDDAKANLRIAERVLEEAVAERIARVAAAEERMRAHPHV